jgi:hypothetical protein
LFGTNAVAAFRAGGLIRDTTPPTTEVTIPTENSTLRGTPFLSASASDSFGVTKVQFEVSGEGLVDTVVSAAAPYRYGWLGSWHTESVPNGQYRLQSVAYNAAGKVGHSKSILVKVEN